MCKFSQRNALVMISLQYILLASSTTMYLSMRYDGVYRYIVVLLCDHDLTTPWTL